MVVLCYYYQGKSCPEFELIDRYGCPTDRMRIFYRACEKKQQIECKLFLCDSVIRHACQNIIGPTGETAQDDSSRTMYNL